jgi:putative ABC transport system substrate-binding protein
MRRREFITLVGGAAAWPLAAQAQQPTKVRRIGVLMSLAASDPVARPEIAALQRGLGDLGWTDDHNIKIEYRWASGETERIRTLAQELVELQCEVIFSRTTPVTAALMRETRTVPIVFAQVSDPVGNRFVASFARPGRNVTGFTNIESSMPGKWVELLKEIAPRVTRVAAMFNPDTAPTGGLFFLHPFEAAASSLGVEPIATRVYDTAGIETAVAALAREPGGGLIVMPDPFLLTHRELVVGLAARYHLPAIFAFTYWTRWGGLMSYGIDSPDVFRRAASYIDRILKGTKPADLPVQAPVKFELAINLKTAKALGLTISPTLLARADEVIE